MFDRRSLRFSLRTWAALISALSVVALAICLILLTPGDMQKTDDPPSAGPGQAAPEVEAFAADRRRMVADHLATRDIADRRVLVAMSRVPRHRFVPDKYLKMAYADQPLPIGHGQTVSQPYIVALMTQLAQPKPESRALDIGTGSGYQAAVLAEVCGQVYSMEIVCQLADDARRRLDELEYRNVEVRCGDGYRGWLEHAPFDVIIVAAAPGKVPQPLVEQLAPGGRLVIPVGKHFQELLIIEKQPDGSTRQWSAGPVAFVPMTGKARDGN